MSKLPIIMFLVLGHMACDGRHSSREPNAGLPETPSAIQPSTPSQNPDVIPPEVVSFRQEGLERLIVEFSEPIQRIDKITYDYGIESPTWDESRRTLTAAIDQTKLKKDSMASLRLIRFIDDANLQNRKEAVIPVDAQAPSLMDVTILDGNTALLTFNEDVNPSEQTTVTVDGIYPGTISTAQLNGNQLTVKFPDDLTTDNSHQLMITKIADQYGNIADARRHGFTRNASALAPEIVSIKQLPTARWNIETSLVFELEFSEYVVDGRDFDEGNAGSLHEINPLEWLKINGKDLFQAKGHWLPREDHRGGTLKISSYDHGKEFQNGRENTIEMFLRDATGNSQWAKAKLIVDSAAPEFTGDYKKSTQCEMSGLQSFRCKISEPDVKEAVLAPEVLWPADDYNSSVTTEEHEGQKQHWLNFNFKKTVPEEPIVGIMTVDFFDNTNFDRDMDHFFFRASTTPAELLKVTAFSSSIIEFEFSKDVGAIDTLMVDGAEMPFDMNFVDNSLTPMLPSSVVVHFASPLSEGLHKIELKGIRRARNRLVQTEKVELKNLDNRIQSILQSSITQEPDLKRTQDLRFEVTKPFSGNLSAFVWLGAAGSKADKTPFTDFTLTSEGKTSRGTYSVRMHKQTAAELRPISFDQGIILQLLGEPQTKPVYIVWSTRGPSLSIREAGRADGFAVSTYTDVDLDSLELEIVEGTQVIPVNRSWISAYEKSSEDFGFTVNLPDNIRLNTGSYYYKVRVKAARTKNFGIVLSKPYELYLSIK